jgi:hypothetical protein
MKVDSFSSCWDLSTDKRAQIEVIQGELHESGELVAERVRELEPFQLYNQDWRGSEYLKLFEVSLRLLAVAAIYVVIRPYFLNLIKLPEAVLQINGAIVLDLLVLCRHMMYYLIYLLVIVFFYE